MIKIVTLFLFLVFFYTSSTAQLGSYPESYDFEDEDTARAVEFIGIPLKGKFVLPNPHHDANNCMEGESWHCDR